MEVELDVLLEELKTTPPKHPDPFIRILFSLILALIILLFCLYNSVPPPIHDIPLPKHFGATKIYQAHSKKPASYLTGFSYFRDLIFCKISSKTPGKLE